MPSSLIRGIRTAHAWAGATLALLILLSSITGTLLLWKEDYLRLALPEARAPFVPTPERLATIAQAVEARFDPNDIALIQFATADFALTKVVMADSRYAYVDRNGDIVDQWTLNERPEEWLYDLHHRLLIGNTGLTVVGTLALIAIVLVLAGVVVFWPMRRGLRQGVLPKSAARPHLLSSHRNLGIIVALPFLLTLVTAAVLAFPEKSERLLLEQVRSTQKYSDALMEDLDDVSGQGTGDWLPAMQRALQTFPGGEIRSAVVANDFMPSRIIGVRQPDEWHPGGMSRVYIDAAAGHMDVRIDALQLPAIERAYNAIYPLHTGKTGSTLYKVWLTLTGLAVATLSSLGLLSFVKSLAPAQEPPSKTAAS